MGQEMGEDGRTGRGAYKRSGEEGDEGLLEEDESKASAPDKLMGPSDAV